MAVRITATLTARRSDLRADTVSADNTELGRPPGPQLAVAAPARRPPRR